jgi:hypothetical protein
MSQQQQHDEALVRAISSLIASRVRPLIPVDSRRRIDFCSSEQTGTAIYLKLGTGPDSGVFQVELDGESQQVDSFSAVDDTCKVGYKREHLEDKQHDMVITTLGPSPQAPQANSDGTLDIENIMYVVFCFCCVPWTCF